MQRADTATPRQSIYGKKQPTRLIVERSGDYTITPKDRVFVDDRPFVQDLFTSLQQPPTNPFKHYLLIAPFAFIFVDSGGDVCGAFRYSASSGPGDLFRPCRIERRGGDYIIRGLALAREGIVVPGFRDQFPPYKDLMEP
jgi:hypothetical protein